MSTAAARKQVVDPGEAMSQEASTEEEQIRATMTRSSFANAADEYREADLDAIVQWYAPDAISMPSGHHALFGHDEIRAWYAKRTGEGHERNAISEVDLVDVVGDVAIVVGTFRVTRAPEEGVAALDHGGRFLSVLRRVDGQWRMWRDMDTTSPDADKYYLKQPRGW